MSEELATMNEFTNPVFVAIKNADSLEAKIATYNALSDSVPLRDHIGEALDITGVMIRDDKLESEGMERDSKMTVLIASDGTGYLTHSEGVYLAVLNLLGTFGKPEEWPDSLKVVPVEQVSRRGYKFLTLRTVI